MPPAPITVEAACLTLQAHHLLTFEALPVGRCPAFGPPVYLRFAFAPVYGSDYLVPDKIVDDRGLEISAPEAYDWLEARGDAFPRADVVGQTPQGRPLQRFVKELDLAAPPLAFAARSPDEFPGARLSFWLGASPPEALSPARLRLLERAVSHSLGVPASTDEQLGEFLTRALERQSP
jgi:hypothetical protein